MLYTVYREHNIISVGRDYMELTRRILFVNSNRNTNHWYSCEILIYCGPTKAIVSAAFRSLLKSFRSIWYLLPSRRRRPSFRNPRNKYRAFYFFLLVELINKLPFFFFSKKKIHYCLSRSENTRTKEKYCCWPNAYNIYTVWYTLGFRRH